MSTFLSQARARALRPVSGLPRPRLTIVPQLAARASKIPFVLLVVTVLAVGLVGLLVLNTSLERGAYITGALRAQSAALDQREQDLQMSVAALQAPQRVSQRAEQLGMVSNDSPAFLVLRTGKMIGVPAAGVATNVVNIDAAPRGSKASVSKVVDPLAGSRNSLGTPPQVVPGPHDGQVRAATKAGDTQSTSAGSASPQGRHNTSTPGRRQSR